MDFTCKYYQIKQMKIEERSQLTRKQEERLEVIDSF